MITRIFSLRNSVLTLFFLAISFSLFAQEQQSATEKGISPKIGVKGGVNFSNMYVDDVEDENLKVGLNLGLFAKLPVTKGLSIQPEILYSSKGSKVKYNNLFGRGEYRYNFNYIEMPVLAVINIVKNFNVHAGGYMGYLASANIKDMNDDGTINGTKDLNAENFNRFDYGLVGGFGVDVQEVTIGARYNYGLKEVGESGTLTGSLLKNSKNSAFTLYIGFGF